VVERLDFLVVEDDPILRDFLVGELSAAAQLEEGAVRAAGSVASAEQALRQATPDALLLDLNLPDGSGVQVAQRYVHLAAAPRILILTGQIDQYSLPLELHCHVQAVLNKADGLSPLRSALWQLLAGLSDAAPDLSVLSPRQLEMLHLLGQGLDTSEIAERLGITFATAQTHRRQITGRLGVKGSRLLQLARSLPQPDAPDV
jgi:DNA-binding NarL/FixJ family response regulator